jgi:hypothetical protein
VRFARVSALTVLLVSGAALRAAEKAPAVPAPVPVPYPNAATTASSAARDPQSGLPTGKRMHKPYVLSASGRKFTLVDGRTFVVNPQTGEVVFGDGVEGRRPETGKTPGDGAYRLGGGSAGNVEVRDGRILSLTPVPTPAAAHAASKAKEGKESP